MNGRLLLVPNALDLGGQPGPLGDVLPEGVIRCAATLTHWVVEDARSARAFIKRLEAHTPLAQTLQSMSICELPKVRKGSGDVIATPVWQALLAPAFKGHDVGLLSEAGLPAVADPGAALVQAAHDLHLAVVPLAGPSSITLAVAASGLNGQSFAFVGYLPQDPAMRAARLRELEQLSRKNQQTQVLIETPYRNSALVQALLQTLAPSTRLAISVGLTLPEGWVRCLPISRWREKPPILPDKVPAVFALLA